MILKTSFVCLVFVIYMGIFYFSKKHLPLKSSKIFLHCYSWAVVVTIFDFITLYTVNNLERVPEIVNLTAHIVYLLSINTMMYYYFLYLRSLLESRIQIQKGLKILQACPYIITSVLILILPITYIKGAYTNYSLGPKAYALYLSVILYNLFVLYYCIRYWKHLDKEKSIAILVSVPVFFIVSMIAIIFPESLLVILYVVLSMLGLMMSNENNEKYIDSHTEMFNQYALGTVINEYIALKKNVFLTVMVMSKTDESEGIDWEGYIAVMKQIQKFCKAEHKHQIYRVSDNGYLILSDSRTTAERVAASVIKYTESSCDADIVTESKIFELNAFDNNKVLMSEIVQICSEAINKMAIYDTLTGVRNRNSLEEQLEFYQKKEIDAYYLIADLNNLKVTNDALGHSAGDELLQTMAKLLKETTKKEGMVFRYGGDEFVVLWKGQNVEQYLEQLEKNCKRVNEKRAIPISYAIGYGKVLDKDGRECADKMMYENKRSMKAQKNR